MFTRRIKYQLDCVRRGWIKMLIEWDVKRVKELVELWNKELTDAFPMRESLFIQNSFEDPNLFQEGSAIAVNEAGDVVGFIVSKKWQGEAEYGFDSKTGWIQVLLVDRDHQNKGIGTKLLNHAEKNLTKSGVERILLGQDTFHYFPGIPSEDFKTGDWVKKKGYQAGDEIVDLDQRYLEAEPSTLPIRSDVSVSLLKIEEKEEFIRFLNHAFPGRWTYEAEMYFENSGTGREFVILKKAGSIIGFCRINDDTSPVIGPNVYWSPRYPGEHGGVGPLGIEASERKRGYGLFIVEAGIHYLRERAVDSILIDWTSLIDFYGKLGYEICIRYISYQKIC